MQDGNIGYSLPIDEEIFSKSPVDTFRIKIAEWLGAGFQITSPKQKEGWVVSGPFESTEWCKGMHLADVLTEVVKRAGDEVVIAGIRSTVTHKSAWSIDELDERYDWSIIERLEAESRAARLRAIERSANEKPACDLNTPSL